MRNPEKRKRPRALQACEVCRTRKNRCSEDRPCTYCIEHDLECTYSRRGLDKRPRSTNTATTATRASESQEEPSTIGFELSQRREPQSAQSNLDGETLVAGRSDDRIENAASDLLEASLHTENLEYYGGSSPVAFLRQADSVANSQYVSSAAPLLQLSLDLSSNNAHFRPTSTQPVSAPDAEMGQRAEKLYFRVAQRFLDAYFSNIHRIQPIFDEELFLRWCESLWFDTSEHQSLPFLALYYATLGVGSLVIACEDWDKFGFNRFIWAEKLLNEALHIVRQLGSSSNLEVAQCYYMISKIYQHQLNPHVAYLFSGQAVRMALSIGINRKPPEQASSDQQDPSLASKTWWAIYCQDIQTSFALGRPDSLGSDQFHTQKLPVIFDSADTDPSHEETLLRVVPCVVEISQIMRRVGLCLYATSLSVEERLRQVEFLDFELEAWQKNLPGHLQLIKRNPQENVLKPKHPATNFDKQAVVLQLRYLNLKMTIHGVFMHPAETIPVNQESSVQRSREVCLDSADGIIDLIYETFSNYSFFQTWWSNVTYTLFAVTMLLKAVFHDSLTTKRTLNDILGQVDRAVTILQAMEEFIVARKAICMIKRTLRRAPKHTQHLRANFAASGTLRDSAAETSPWTDTSLEQGIEFPNLLRENGSAETAYDVMDESLSWLDPNPNPFDDAQQPLFWTTWAQELDRLGT